MSQFLIFFLAINQIKLIQINFNLIPLNIDFFIHDYKYENIYVEYTSLNCVNDKILFKEMLR